MTTATDINLDIITTGEAKLTLDKVISLIANGSSFDISYSNELSGTIDEFNSLLIAYDDVAIIAYALENNLQLRDYLMGLTSDGLSVESVARILRVLVALFHIAQLPAYPIETVLASYMYRLGDSDALTMLANGLARDYSLAKLLYRVMNSGWSPAEFATMSDNLHSKVIAELTRTSELLVNEANR
jgi:hypothetical protein